jgi:hypothetical protein
MSLKAGDTFLLPIRLEWKDHLFVVVYDSSSEEEVLIVNFTSAKPHSDRTTVLQEGDHPFISRETVVNYSDATIACLKKLETAISGGLGSTNEPVEMDLLRKIREGIFQSPRTKIKIQKFADKQGGIF